MRIYNSLLEFLVFQKILPDDEWVKELKPTLQKTGWFGKSVELINPKTKEKEFIEVGASRLKKIFYTNAKTAYQQSRAREQFSENNKDEYLRYVAILDTRTRHTHAQMHGLILKKSNDFWKRNYPPNGWNCRCAVEFVSKDEMKTQGWSEMSEAEKKLGFAHKDWDYDTRNLEKNDNDLQLIIKNKLEKLAKNKSAVEALELLREQVREGRKAWEMVKELKNAKEQTILPLCKMPNDLNKFLGNEAENFEMGSRELQTHLNKHKELSAFDYALTPYFLHNNKLEIWQDEDIKNPNKYLAVNKLGKWYMMSFKSLPKEKRIFFESLVHSSKKESLTKHKMKIWSRDEA